MSLVLGIDVGGTYTDGVILDVNTRKILTKTKVETTHNNLITCISNCIDNLNYDLLKNVNLLALSTTLATNAIVEGRGSEVGLLVIGYELENKIPAKKYAFLPGGHNAAGIPQKELDISYAHKVIEEFKGEVEAIAVSGYFSVRNPEHELTVRKLVHEILNVPVVCAHDLSSSLGFYERTVTAVLNAKLIPIITELIDAVKKILEEKEIKAPLMMVKGDGSLMSEEMAREKPIDTLLSGPAASIAGAAFLVELKDALVLDMGGTTTDIAILQNGIPRLKEEGATVGGWRTRVKTAEINTYGIGGDSYIQVDKEKRILIGPYRVKPLSLLAHEYPYLLQELQNGMQSKKISFIKSQPTDCFYLNKLLVLEYLSEIQIEALEILSKNGPHTLFFLANQLEKEPFMLNLEDLVKKGILAKSSLTPTDILHILNIYTPGNQKAAIIGAKILAQKAKIAYEDFLKQVLKIMINKISKATLQSVINFENGCFQIENDIGANFFVEKALVQQSSFLINFSVQLKTPLITIGAPVKAYLPKVAKKLNAELVIPPHAEVANAIGAAAGKIVEVVKILVKSYPGSKISVHTPFGRKEFDTLEEASEFARQEALRCAALKAEKAGARTYEVDLRKKDIIIKEGNVLVESEITATAIGWPEWEKVTQQALS